MARQPKLTSERVADLLPFFSTQKELADSLGVHSSTVSRWVRGINQPRSPQIKQKVARRERYYLNERPKQIKADPGKLSDIIEPGSEIFEAIRGFESGSLSVENQNLKEFNITIDVIFDGELTQEDIPFFTTRSRGVRDSDVISLLYSAFRWAMRQHNNSSDLAVSVNEIAS